VQKEVKLVGIIIQVSFANWSWNWIIFHYLFL